MIDVLLNTLAKGLNGDLCGNRFAYKLYSYLESNEELPDYNLLSSYVQSPEPVPDNIPEWVQSGKDLRFQLLDVGGVRRLPAEAGEQYRLSFTGSDGRPCSSVFLGHNGVGKTTLFYCLEKVSLGQLYSVIFKDTDFYSETDFLRNLRTPQENVRIDLTTASATVSNVGLTSGSLVLPPASFCSDNDVYHLLKYGITADYIAEQLSLSKYLTLIRQLNAIDDEWSDKWSEYEQFKKERNWSALLIGCLNHISSAEYREDENPFSSLYEWADIRALPKDQQQDEVFKWRARIWDYIGEMGIDMSLIVKDIAPLEPDCKLNRYEKYFKSIDDVLNYIQNQLSQYSVYNGSLEWTAEGRENLSAMIQNIVEFQRARENKIDEIETQYPLVLSDDEVEDKFLRVRDYLLKQYQDILKSLIKHCEVIFDAVIKDYFERDIEAVNIIYGNGYTFDIKFHTRDPKTGEVSQYDKDVLPQLYLNTFRFKAFCVAFKISLALYSQQLHKMNFPIVIDDVFDSSDFANRTKIKDFIYHVFTSQQKLFKDYASWPLQLIFFTQDNVVADSVYKAISSYDDFGSVKLSRLYNFFEADDEDKVQAGGSVSIKIEDIIKS